MFILTKLSDLIRLPPHTFNVPIHQALTNEIHKKYSNKIIHNVGLAISIWDIEDIKEGLLRPGDGGSHVEITFRMIVWKPFIGELLEGVVTDCNVEGIKVKLDFFDEIFIRKEMLFENCEFKGVERAWCWKPDDENELFIDLNERIRFRVEEEAFYNIKPRTDNSTTRDPEEDEAQKTNRTPPYAIYASCQAAGTGCVSWWD
ncbi:DNA-directed RNA polymerase III complex subunit Rpc25 [Yamadazyma tenuis]|uniref:DNA-directed RNA polymerase subunit n=1 Tax=Candida tenuis (strain ATCC 10573 / BCRC 21748 / CBS 615 / JCM 9827 / NBRC 10315 / NRRL Y-1498 / VKM Y-70) TaxID=590646 RepID=G3BDR6_CANTC|nr:uncharacterized protein CANTEDRAFT_110098 [Yamadazyma tenuis ATCC 10573]EGV60362.1 hypothetical protein CANTEDRAFT_110098 [Yamadazyma tenuis ATCC 10573]WEJ94393.1 DNA-directed RNA polymerase III complex subunit Rpc25 [Yamadazyma tenuis]